MYKISIEALKEIIEESKKSKIDNALSCYNNAAHFIASGGKLNEVEEFYLEQIEQILDSIHTK